MHHAFSIRVTVLSDRTKSPCRALARWVGWSRRSRQGKLKPPRMVWHEANTATEPPLRVNVGRSGTIVQDQLGHTWAHGWEGPDVDALLAAGALMC